MQWVQAFFISGDEVIDGIGHAISLRRKGEQVLLEGGVLTKSHDFLLRQGKSGVILRFKQVDLWDMPAPVLCSLLSRAATLQDIILRYPAVRLRKLNTIHEETALD